MKKLFVTTLIITLSIDCYSQNKLVKSKGGSLLNNVSSKSENENLKNLLIDSKDDFIKNSLNVLLKDIQDINNELEDNLSKNIEKLIKENKEYLNQLENEYRSKLKEEHAQISELKKSVDDILKIKDMELKIVNLKINEINKNLKNLSSDEYIKKFKKDLKKQLEEFKESTIDSFEDKLKIKLDTINNGKN
jgi:hypothetical protein